MKFTKDVSRSKIALANMMCALSFNCKQEGNIVGSHTPVERGGGIRSKVWASGS